MQVAARERRAVGPMEFEVHLPSGRRWIAEAAGAPIIAADEPLLGAVVVDVDLTERKQNLEALRASEARFRALFETSRDGISVVELDGRFIDANPALQQMLGYTRDELARLSYQQLTPEIWHETEAQIVRERSFAASPGEYEKELIRKDGSAVPVSLRVWGFTGDDGRIAGMRAFWCATSPSGRRPRRRCARTRRW